MNSQYAQMNLNDMVRLYKAGGHRDDHELMKEIMRQAESVANCIWGNKEKRFATNDQRRRLHEECWQSFEVLLTECLNNFIPDKQVRFSTYLTTALKNKSNAAYSFINRDKRRGNLHTQELMDYSGVVKGGHRSSPTDPANIAAHAELVGRIKEDIICFMTSDAMSFRDFSCLIQNQFDDKTLDIIGNSLDRKVSKERVRHYILAAEKDLSMLRDQFTKNNTCTADEFECACLDALHSIREGLKDGSITIKPSEEGVGNARPAHRFRLRSRKPATDSSNGLHSL